MLYVFIVWNSKGPLKKASEEIKQNKLQMNWKVQFVSSLPTVKTSSNTSATTTNMNINTNINTNASVNVNTNVNANVNDNVNTNDKSPDVTTTSSTVVDSNSNMTNTVKSLPSVAESKTALSEAVVAENTPSAPAKDFQ
ncbi:rhoptry protein, partial [Reticulomyxa filosa]